MITFLTIVLQTRLKEAKSPFKGLRATEWKKPAHSDVHPPLCTGPWEPCLVGDAEYGTAEGRGTWCEKGRVEGTQPATSWAAGWCPDLPHPDLRSLSYQKLTELLRQNPFSRIRQESIPKASWISNHFAK